MRLPQFDLSQMSTAEIWRRISPKSLLDDAQTRAATAKRLTASLESLKFTVPEIAAEVDLIKEGDLRPLLHTLSQLPDGPGRWQQARYDLRMSLVLWAVVHANLNWVFAKDSDHIAARLLMASGLAQWAKNLPPPSKSVMSTPRHRRDGPERAQVSAWRKERRRCERLALEWLREGINAAWLRRLDSELKTAERSSYGSDVRDTEKRPPEPAVVGPAKVIMPSPLDEASGGSRERKEEARHWNRLSRPLPLIAARPPEALRDDLYAEFPWMRAAIDRITVELRLRHRGSDGGWFHFRPLLLVGPPATGKSRFARRLAELAGIFSRVMSVAGSSDARELLGTARGWGSATPSGPARLIRESGQANPLMIIDEIDKVGSSNHNGRITDAILTMTEPETASRWYDEGLGRSIDLSAVNWIFLANSLAPLPGPLKSRLAIIEVERPKAEHFASILNGMLHDIAGELGLPTQELPMLHPEAAAYLQRQFARGASLRQIKGAVSRALAVSTSGEEQMG